MSGMDKRASVDEADSDAGCAIEPANTSNELTEFVVLSVKPYVKNSSDIPHVYLGGTQMWMGNANCPGC